jgi:hypothetical protein
MRAARREAQESLTAARGLREPRYPWRLVPQLAQNFAPGAATVPQAGHGFGCGGARDVPHSAQKRPGGTVAPQPGQLTPAAWGPPCGPPCG